MRVLVTGGTGFVGAPLCRALQAAGHGVTVVSREPGRVPARAVGWPEVPAAMAETDAVVNLAGEPLAAGRWTAARKAAIRASRVEATRALVRAVAGSPAKPSVLVSASAVGWYGPRGDEPLDESAAPGTDFLARVCREWEAEAEAAAMHGVRVVRLRLGVVLAPGGGALARMVLPFRAGVGGRLGNGRQWISWIHRDDVVGLVLAALASDAWRGPVNATAPTPVTNRELTAALARVLHRPAVLPVPGLALRLAFGEMATMLLTGQRVLPRVAETHAYAWRQPELPAALAASVGH